MTLQANKTFDITTDSQPLVSLLTVNYKQAKVTQELIQSLESISYSHWELIVVNNGEEDDELRAACGGNDSTRLVNTGSNLGFAGGNNYGLDFCKGKYVMFINNDTEVARDFLQPLVELAEQDSSIGMISPKIVFHGTDIIQYAGSTPLNEYTMRNASQGLGEKDAGQYDKTYPTGYIHGAAMMLPMQVIQKVGAMYDDYFLYYEEYDWCYRVRSAGYKIYYCGESTVYHKESVSTGSGSPLKTYFLTRNRLLFSRRNFPAFKKYASFAFFTFVALPVHLIRYGTKGRFDLIKATLRGWFWNLHNTSKSNGNRN